MTVSDQDSASGVLTDTPIAPPVADPRKPAAAAPVFVDATGRRARRVRRGAIALATPAAAYLVAVGISLMGGSSLPDAILPFPGHSSNDTSAAASQAPRGGGAEQDTAGSTDDTADVSESADSTPGPAGDDGTDRRDDDSGTQESDNTHSQDSDSTNLEQSDNTHSQDSDSTNLEQSDNTHSQDSDSTNTDNHGQGSSDSKSDTSDSSNDPVPDQAAQQAEENANDPTLPDKANTNATGHEPQPSTSSNASPGQADAHADNAGDPGKRPDRSAAAATNQ